MQKVSIDIGLDSPISALVVRPASGMGPIVLIVHDIFGLSPYMINQAKHLAAKGYLAVCPDLLQAHEPLSERNTADADPARKAWAKLDLARCLETLK
ncbi:MAG: dienelactone hydrolase family protein, partial [Pseudomonadota bacterium]|nr:dienelactone hydrolase family protein [Pseudomonadota bacterium]